MLDEQLLEKHIRRTVTCQEMETNPAVMSGVETYRTPNKVWKQSLIRANYLGAGASKTVPQSQEKAKPQILAAGRCGDPREPVCGRVQDNSTHFHEGPNAVLSRCCAQRADEPSISPAVGLDT
jgi:hypothetical protein